MRCLFKEARYIDYFIRSLNNDAGNQMIVCPNHHRIIHETDPVFDRQTIKYRYPNGYEQGLLLNKHLLAQTWSQDTKKEGMHQ